MPAKGSRATVCKRGHDLSLPDARLKVKPGERGGGGCRQCVVDRTRAKRGSTKTGPPSRYGGDEAARLRALAQGLRRCPYCGEFKDPGEFCRNRHNKDGLSGHCRTCRAAAKKRYFEANRERVLASKRAAAFGITVEHLTEMIESHGGLCAICRSECPTGRALAIDHNHTTGQIRGLLCANCNRAIGLLGDNPDTVRSAWEYLRGWMDAPGNDRVLNGGVS